MSDEVNYDAPTPITDAFMTQIDDSEIDLGQVESKLKTFECELLHARQSIAEKDGEIERLKRGLEVCGYMLDDQIKATLDATNSVLDKQADDEISNLQSALDTARAEALTSALTTERMRNFLIQINEYWNGAEGSAVDAAEAAVELSKEALATPPSPAFAQVREALSSAISVIEANFGESVRGASKVWFDELKAALALMGGEKA